MTSLAMLCPSVSAAQFMTDDYRDVIFAACADASAKFEAVVDLTEGRIGLPRVPEEALDLPATAFGMVPRIGSASRIKRPQSALFQSKTYFLHNDHVFSVNLFRDERRGKTTCSMVSSDNVWIESMLSRLAERHPTVPTFIGPDGTSFFKRGNFGHNPSIQVQTVENPAKMTLRLMDGTSHDYLFHGGLMVSRFDDEPL